MLDVFVIGCKLFSALSLSPSCSMHQGGDSLRQQSYIVLMHLFVVVHAVVLHLTRRRLKLSATQPEKKYF